MDEGALTYMKRSSLDAELVTLESYFLDVEKITMNNAHIRNNPPPTNAVFLIDKLYSRLIINAPSAIATKLKKAA
jgi:hypothetical protein